MVEKKEAKVGKTKVVKREITYTQEQLDKVSEMIDHLQKALNIPANINLKENFIGENKLLNGLMIADAKDKQLKNTLSWSINLPIRVYFQIKNVEGLDKIKTPKDFTQHLKDNKVFEDDENVKLEDSGYVTVINMTKKEVVIDASQTKSNSCKDKKKVKYN